MKTPGNAISETLNFKMPLDASPLKNLSLWCEFQSRLLFIISLLLENFLTTLSTLYLVSNYQRASLCMKSSDVIIQVKSLQHYIHTVIQSTVS